MLKNTMTRVKMLALVAATMGIGVGATASMQASEPISGGGWPHQCWNQDGGPSCPTCGGGCMGGDYICCNQNSES